MANKQRIQLYIVLFNLYNLYHGILTTLLVGGSIKTATQSSLIMPTNCKITYLKIALFIYQ